MRYITIFASILLFMPMTITAQEEVNTDVTDITADLPEGMQENTDSLLRSWNMQRYLLVDTTSQLANINPYFENAVYADRLQRIPSIMDMTYNDIVQKYIDQYTNRLRHSVSYILAASNFYIPIMEEALAFYKIPLELKYLPVIESAYNPRARSRAGAVGLWQFMPRTAVQYGLQINSLVDERCEPIKSSYAAAHYLKDLYTIFGDWTLVIAAYNCGPNNINKAIHRSGGERDFWKIYQNLPRETRGYVPAFIAANYIMNYYGEHNIQPYRARIPATTDTLLINKDVKMEQIATVCGIDIDEIKALNPQYQTTLIPGYRTTCTLRLPQDQLLKFIDLQDSVYAYGVTDEPQVSSQDMNVKEITEKTTVKKSSRSKSRSRSSSAKRITVRSGQTLGEIARRNHTTVAKLRSLNGIRGSNIRAGQKLRVR
ncbi:MAG: transglycosylase SLT domain-containing protein [Bacteroidaceae bacterium]|jgi:membrane-bound lytic murein transglycosylase D|nr:transglycosylase SLT domain-containing protein [Bacteroidaceae bacterium]